MADYMQQLNSLSSTFSLSQLKLDAEGQLEKRNIFEALGHKIKDAFCSLSSAGRTAITARNGELLSAMQKAVDESKHHTEADVRTASDKLATTLSKLQSHINKGSYFAQIKNELTNDPRFASLPETSKGVLNAALENMKDPNLGASPSEWKDCATALKWAFFGESPAGLDTKGGIEKFADTMKETFLSSKHQNQIKDGFNQLTLVDFQRNAIKQVGDIATPRSQGADFYKDALRSVLEGHEELMPFVSTAITQNGIGLLAQRLPAFSGFNMNNPLTLCSVARNMHQQLENVTIRRDADVLVVDATYENGFQASGVNGKGFSQISTVTMRIDLAAEPEHHMVDGKEVLIPQFTLENVSTSFNNPIDIVKDDPRFKAMPEFSQRTLLDALKSIHAGNATAPDKQAAMERLKNDFFGIKPASYHMETAMAQFSTDMGNFFLDPEQQALVDENDLHASFFKDANRGIFSNIGDTMLSKDMPKEVYANALKDYLPEQHHDFLPFISMMASQAGIGSAMAFLPYMSGLSETPTFQHLVDVGVMANRDHTQHKITLSLEDNILRLTDIFSKAFLRENAQDGPPVLHCTGTVSMAIDLTAEPRVETVKIPKTIVIEELDENDVLIEKQQKVLEHKEVLIPQFTIENGEVYFETPSA